MTQAPPTKLANAIESLVAKLKAEGRVRSVTARADFVRDPRSYSLHPSWARR
jgi:hypothetical protein